MILVFCPNGHVFESRAFSFGGNVRGLTLQGNKETCPVCGAWADIMDGSFDVIDGAVRLLSAPRTTLDRLAWLQEALARLRAQNASPQEVAKVVEREAPELSGWLRFAPKDAGGLAAYLAVLIMLIGLVHDWREDNQSSTMTPDDVQQIVKAVIDAQQDTPMPLPPAPPPAPPMTPPSRPAAQAPPATPPPHKP